MIVDVPRPVRAGEELDLGRLAGFLRAQGLPSAGLSQEQFPKGHSNLTYLVRAGSREFVLRRPPVGSKVKTAHDMGREARILLKLQPAFPLAPRVVAVCDDLSVLGAPFYLMERIHGIILRGPEPRGIDVAPATARGIGISFARALAALHAVDFRSAGLEGKPQGYVRRQVEGWSRRWQDARTEDVPEVDEIARWLAERMPEESGAAFIHNDFKYDNLVLDPADLTRVVGVLDWEMSTVGDPLMDLGTALGYWVQADDPEPLKAFAFGPTFLPGSLTREEVVEEYARASGRELPSMLFYVCFALFKTAVVAQQIYKRYAEGLTKDERFAALGIGVRILANAAVEAAGRGRF
ncbi:MAG TPA: phosphotransferase family protein [Myxococcales bacterium]|nr:phosphotransferase family protein [Myxococcales bacterium]